MLICKQSVHQFQSPMMCPSDNFLSWSAMTCTLVGCWLNARQKLSCWLVWSVGNVLWFTLAWHRQDLPQMLLAVILSALNVYGAIKWKSHSQSKS